MSQSVVSLLKGAGTVRGGQLRYPKVAREYAALGHDAFVHKYLTAPIRERLMVGITEMKAAERAKAFDETLNAKGYSARANRYEDRYEWPETSIGLHAVFRIECHHDGGGYFWRNLKPFQDQPEIPADQVRFHPACYLHGDPARGPERGPGSKGFPTSEACYRYVRNEMNPKL